jgi:hypothetical protein
MFNGRSPRLDAAKLEREITTLQLKLLRTNAELKLSQTYASRLEVLVHERCAMIDALHGRIDALRTENKRLEQEAEHYAALLAAPQLNATA